MAEIRDGTMKDVLVKLRLLSDEIAEVNRRFGTVDRTGSTLDDLRVKVNCYENDMPDLRRQGRARLDTFTLTKPAGGNIPDPHVLWGTQ